MNEKLIEKQNLYEITEIPIITLFLSYNNAIVAVYNNWSNVWLLV